MDRRRSKPSIIFVTHEFTPSGAPLFLLDLFNGCPDMVGGITIVGPPGGTARARFAELENVRIVPLSLIPMLFSGRRNAVLRFAYLPVRFVLNGLLFWKLLVLFKRSHADIIYLNSFSTRFAALPAAFSGKSVIWHMHEYGVGPPIFRRSFRRLAAWTADLVIGNSEITLDWWREQPSRTDYAIVSNPAPDRTAPSGGTSPQFDTVFVGRLEPLKGLQILLRSLRILKNRGNTVTLVILGYWSADAYRREIEEYIKTNDLQAQVSFSREGADALEVLSSARVAVVPTFQESFGRVVVEAMACGVPVIASNVGAVPGIIRNEVTGLLVAPGDPEELAGAIGNLLASPMRMKSMAAAALLSVRERFGRAQFRGQVASAIGRLAGRVGG